MNSIKKATPDKENSLSVIQSKCNTLPENLEERINLVLNSGLSPQKTRLIVYLKDHPDTWTHTLAQNCAVGYPPCRLWELNHDVLPYYGLHVHCHAPKRWLMNRHGEESKVHQWRIVLIPAVKRAA